MTHTSKHLQLLLRCLAHFFIGFFEPFIGQFQLSCPFVNFAFQIIDQSIVLFQLPIGLNQIRSRGGKGFRILDITHGVTALLVGNAKNANDNNAVVVTVRIATLAVQGQSQKVFNVGMPIGTTHDLISLDVVTNDRRLGRVDTSNQGCEIGKGKVGTMLFKEQLGSFGCMIHRRGGMQPNLFGLEGVTFVNSDFADKAVFTFHELQDSIEQTVVNDFGLFILKKVLGGGCDTIHEFPTLLVEFQFLFMTMMHAAVNAIAAVETGVGAATRGGGGTAAATAVEAVARRVFGLDSCKPYLRMGFICFCFRCLLLLLLEEWTGRPRRR